MDRQIRLEVYDLNGTLYLVNSARYRIGKNKIDNIPYRNEKISAIISSLPRLAGVNYIHNKEKGKISISLKIEGKQRTWIPEKAKMPKEISNFIDDCVD